MIILFTPVDILFCNDDLVLYVDYNLEKNERLSGYNFLINKVLVKRLISLLKDVSPRSSRSTSLSTCPFYLSMCLFIRLLVHWCSSDFLISIYLKFKRAC